MFKKTIKVFAMLIVAQFAFTASFATATVFKNKIGSKETKLSSGVTHTLETYRTNSIYQSVNLLNINLNDEFTKVEIGMPNPLQQLKTTTTFAKENSYAGHRVVGATNAAFFSGQGPVNLIAEDNIIKHYGILGGNYESPTQQPVAFGISKTGQAIADYYSTKLTFTPSGSTNININGVNRQRMEGQTNLYTSAVSGTGTNQWGVEVVVSNASKNTKDLAFGDEITGTIQSISKVGQGGNAKVPANGFVISTNNKITISYLEKLAVGTSVKLNIHIDEKWQDAEYILGAGPLLVKDKKTHISMPTASSFVSSRHPRTAIGIDATGKNVFLVTVDGRRKGHSNGTNLQDLSKLLIEKGAVSAINLDGGGSTTMVTSQPGSLNPKLVNKPSDGFERRVSAIIQAVSVEPPGNVKSFRVAAASTVIEKGATVQIEIKDATDIYGNPIQKPTQPVTWQVEGNIGKMEGNQFIATNVGTGHIIATIGGQTSKLQLQVFDPEQGAISLDAMTSNQNFKIATVKAKASLANSTNAENQQFGKKSLKVNYDFTTAEAGTKAAYVKAKQPIKIHGYPKQLGVWVHADKNKNWLRGTVIDGTGKKHTIDFTKPDALTGATWQYVTAKVPENLPAPLSFEQIYIAQPNAALQKKGAIYLAELEAAYENNYVSSTYFDVKMNHWAFGAIQYLNKSGLTKGYPNGTFKPNDSLTRAEAASLIARALNLKTTKPNPFNDVNKNNFAYADIAAVAEKGIVVGREDGKFHPNGALTRAEMASILTRAFTLSPQTTTPKAFNDVPTSHWAYSSITQLVKSELTSGYPDGTFKPNEQITRAEFASFLDRVLN